MPHLDAKQDIPVTPGKDAAIERLRSRLGERIGSGRYETWFKHASFRVDETNTLIVGTRNRHTQEWLAKQFGPDLQAVVAEVFPDPPSVRFVIDPRLFQQARSEQADAKREGTLDLEAPPMPLEGPRKQQTLFDDAAPEPAKAVPQRKWRSLSEFVVGAGNRVAHASALSVVEDPGQGANPLVLYGPTGTGKTHLLEGIYAGLRRRWPTMRPLFTTAEEFMNRFVQAMRANKQASFRKTYRECGALIVDNLSFLAGKKATQEEFLHTFDALVAEGRQVVVTCDSHPRLADELMPELVDRLLGGATWSMLPPDRDTRLAILRAKTVGTNPPVPPAVLEFLSEKLRGNVRELEGALNGIRHYARVAALPVTLDLAREAVGDLLRHAVRVVSVGDVEAAICDILRLPNGALKSKKRAWAVSHPRMLAMYLGRKHTAATYSEISAYFGCGSHGTAVAAEKKVKKWLQSNEPLKAGDRDWSVRDLVEKVERQLGV